MLLTILLPLTNSTVMVSFFWVRERICSSIMAGVKGVSMETLFYHRISYIFYLSKFIIIPTLNSMV